MLKYEYAFYYFQKADYVLQRTIPIDNTGWQSAVLSGLHFTSREHTFTLSEQQCKQTDFI